MVRPEGRRGRSGATPVSPMKKSPDAERVRNAKSSVARRTGAWYRSGGRAQALQDLLVDAAEGARGHDHDDVAILCFGGDAFGDVVEVRDVLDRHAVLVEALGDVGDGHHLVETIPGLVA